MTSPDAATPPDGVAPTPVSLYVHVPFCVSKCAYCDFHSEPGRVAQYARFVDAALFEAGRWSRFGLLDDVPTLYMGGGTPTVMADELVRLVRGLMGTARLRPDAEITVEANPESTSPGLVAALVDAGANRFSLGVQSYDDAVLATLGRRHDAARAREVCATLARSGVPFSIDLICGVPGQSMPSWRETLREAVSCGASHVSVYPLGVEPGTPMAEAVDSGALPEPDPDAAADMMLAAGDALPAAGTPRYEVASYARAGFEAKHNLGYWTGRAYLGIGPSASSMLPQGAFACVAGAEGWPMPESGEAARVRFTRAADTDAYLRSPFEAPAELECLSADEAAREDVMLGLRLAGGVPAAQVSAAGLDRVLARLAAGGLAELAGDRWRTTQRGWLLGNEVFGAVWAGE